MSAGCLAQPYLDQEGWVEVRDGNANARDMFDRHYSRRKYADGRTPKLFVGPGRKMVLIRADGSALVVWRKFISDDGQTGINCAVFRREAGDVASALLTEAMRLAWDRWPGERMFTYVDPRFVPPTFRAGRPTWGHCFYVAGWRFVGVTKGRLHILECFQEWVSA